MCRHTYPREEVILQKNITPTKIQFSSDPSFECVTSSGRISLILFTMAQVPVVVMDRGNNTTCTINLHGCTIVSWRVNNQEQLFVSKRSVFDGKKAIRGGIPFVFPIFGASSVMPQHGFARISRYTRTYTGKEKKAM